MIGKIAGWFASSAIDAVGNQLNRAYENKLNAANDAERIAADVTIEQLEARRSVLVAEAHSKLTAWIRPFIALPIGLYIWKLFLWDAVLGWGTTPPPGEIMKWIITAVVGAYFLTRPIEKALGK